MKNFERFLKRLFYFFVTKKMLLAIIFLLFFMLISKNVFATHYITSIRYNNHTYTFPSFDVDAIPNNKPYIVVWQEGMVEFLFPRSTSSTNNYKWFKMEEGKIGVYCDGVRSYFDEFYCDNFTSGNYYFYNGANTAEYSNTKILIYSSDNIYEGSYNTTNIWYPASSLVDPYILDSDYNLASLDMTNITIDPGTKTLEGLSILITTSSVGSNNASFVYGTILDEQSPFYKTNGVNGYFFEIPTEILKPLLIPKNEVYYMLSWSLPNDPSSYRETRTVIYDPDLVNLTEEEKLAYSINNDFNRLQNTITNQFGFLGDLLNNQFSNLTQEQQQQFLQQYQLQQQQYQSQQETENATKDTNKFLKNQNFDNSNLNLPTSPGNDITEDGINNIFTMIYNSFTSGQAPDIVIPIPYTNKSFTIPANYLSNILSGTVFSPIKTLIELFWWYIISTYIIRDISKKMNKMKSGDLENLENSNIKEEML